MANFRHDPRGDSVWAPTRGWLDAFQSENPTQKGIVWVGEPGRGKTHLMVAVLRELVFRYGVECRFIEFTHLISSIREGIERHDGDATTLTPLVNVPVLAIDELGKGRKTDFELSIIDELITRRYNAQRLVMGTTNFPKSRNEKQKAPSSLAMAGQETLSERLGERVYSRLFEVVMLLDAPGEDFRVTRGR